MASSLDSLSRFAEQSSHFLRQNSGVISATAAATLAVVSATRYVYSAKPKGKILKGPRDAVRNLSAAEKADLPYPPDAFPGARDVKTPYGTFRLYEWGPEDGRKVLLIHGITTPCPSVGGVARFLAEKGCRVMIFDLWGRGYSDCPGDLPHDARLYTAQILSAVASSPISWVGGPDGGFSIIGYSMGAALGQAFACDYPHLVKSLVMLAPAGLIRAKHLSKSQQFAFNSGVLPESLVHKLMYRQLNQGSVFKKNPEKDGEKIGVATVVGAEGGEQSGADRLFNSTPKVANPVAWQLQAHPGFVHAFISSLRNAPIYHNNEDWKRLALRKDKILIIAGTTDPVVVYEELRPDANEAVGAEKLEWRTIEGAHDFPVVSAKQTAEAIAEFWGL